MTATTTQSRSRVSYARAIGEAIDLEMEADPAVVVMGEEVGEHGGVFTITRGLLDKYGPDRVIDTPIAEAGFAGIAVGAAAAGLRPIVEIMFADFLLVAADQLLNQAAKMSFMSGGEIQIPMVVRASIGAAAGGPHHSQSLEALFAHVPGFSVLLPSTPADAKGLMAAAIRSRQPAILFEHRGIIFAKDHVPAGEHVVPLGQAAIRREGADVTVLSYSKAVHDALAAASMLADRGVDVEVVDLRTLVPLDEETILESVRKTGRVVVVHEAGLSFGPGAEIASRIHEQAWDQLRAPVLRVGGGDTPVPYSQPLEATWLPGQERIIDAITRVLATGG